MGKRRRRKKGLIDKASDLADNIAPILYCLQCDLEEKDLPPLSTFQARILAKLLVPFFTGDQPNNAHEENLHQMAAIFAVQESSGQFHRKAAHSHHYEVSVN